MGQVSQIPIVTPLVPTSGFRAVTEGWFRWLLELVTRVNAAPERLNVPLELTAQSASIAATAIALPTLTAGLYRVSYSTRVTRAATTSSELTITIHWTHGGIALSQAGALLNGNTTATQQTGTLLVRIDTETTIRYQTTYASVGGTTMQYRLDVTVERIPG